MDFVHSHSSEDHGFIDSHQWRICILVRFALDLNVFWYLQQISGLHIPLDNPPQAPTAAGLRHKRASGSR